MLPHDFTTYRLEIKNFIEDLGIPYFILNKNVYIVQCCLDIQKLCFCLITFPTISSIISWHSFRTIERIKTINIRWGVISLHLTKVNALIRH